MYFANLQRIKAKLIDLGVNHIIPEDAKSIDFEEIEGEKFCLPGNIYYEPFYIHHVLTYEMQNGTTVKIEITKLHS